MKYLARAFILTLSLHIILNGQTSSLRSGPMVGYGQMTEVLLWMQTTKPATVQYRYWDISEPKTKMMSATAKTTEEQSFVAKTLIAGLQPGKKFEYELLLDGKAVKRNYPLRFQTQPLWQWRTDPPEFSVAFGSCAYINETEWDRPGKSYGSDYEIFTTIAAKNPDIMLWTGDNIYLREIDWDTKSGILHRNAHTRQTPEMQPLLGAAHNYAIWDDHDFGPNNADRSYRLRDETLEAFKLFWANQTYGTAETKGTFGRFVWGDVEFFLLDDRYHRSPNFSPNDERKTMFGNEQLRWLKDALSNSLENRNVNFRIIANGNQILNPHGEFYEALPLYTHEYNDLIRYIKTNNIPGIVFLSGDRHHTELIALPDTSFYTLYDYTNSALTSELNSLKNRDSVPLKEFSNPMRVEGTLVNDKHNFGMLRFTGTRKGRKIVLECYDLTGILRWSKEITANELQPK